ncbi:MAG TPA: hypothetical protein VKT78_18835, partial [Fimbriimonadaceae bacterium]|nr:hypothetical protein [Fimbriimonadaceae bacterium]
EMENGNDTPALWQGVQEAVRAAKEADPDHPVMTSVAEVTQEKIDLIRRYAPDIDVLGINSYGGLPSLARRLRQFGWTKPYIVTEFGPLGHWECGKTAWGAPIEQTSTEKARTYQTGYEASVAGQPGMCLGSYAFLWGSKQEATPTWFGMMLATGEPLEAVDVMQMEWTGSWPRERAPRIVNFTLSGELQAIEPGEKLTTTLLADGAELRYRWEVRAEVAERRQDGKGEKTPEPLPIPFTSSPNGGGTFRAPTAAGSYRLYAYAISRDGRAATANIPFRVMA